MIIELAGLPGSGKTTLCNEIVTSLRQEGMDVWCKGDYWPAKKEDDSRWRKIVVVAKKMRKTASVSLWSQSAMRAVPWSGIFKGARRLSPYLIKSIISNISINSDARSTDYNRVNVIDEGVVHRSYSMFVFGGHDIKKDRVLRYLDNIDCPDMLLFLEVDPDIAVRRMMLRGLPWRMRAYDQAQVWDMLMRGKELFEVVVEYLRTQRSVRIRSYRQEKGKPQDVIEWIKKNVRSVC